MYAPTTPQQSTHDEEDAIDDAPAQHSACTETPTEHDASDDKITITERILCGRQMTAAVVVPDLLAEPNVSVMLYLCSEAEREGSLAAHLLQGGLHTEQVD
eukprot:1058201-Pleurochrysis_carterae.AAC.2